MKTLNFISGLPRSGSTLISNILKQNPEVYSEAVSSLSAVVGSVNLNWEGLEPNIEYIDTPADIRDKYQYFTEATMAKLRAIGYTQEFMSLEAGVKDYVQNYLAKQLYYSIASLLLLRRNLCHRRIIDCWLQRLIGWQYGCFLYSVTQLQKSINYRLLFQLKALIHKWAWLTTRFLLVHSS